MNEWQLDFQLNEGAKAIFLALLFILIFCLLLTLLPQTKDEIELYPTWDVGLIDESGSFIKSEKDSLVSSSLIIKNGFKIKVDSGKEANYYIAYYDSEQNFIGISEEHKGNVVVLYSELQKEYTDVMYFKVILKDVESDGYINFFEQYKFEKYVSIYELNA